MTRLFFDQTSFESRGRLYMIALFAEEGPDDPIPHGGSCFYGVIPLFKYRRSPTRTRQTLSAPATPPLCPSQEQYQQKAP